MADSKSLITNEASSVDDRVLEGSSQSSVIESCLPGNNFCQVMHDLLFFEFQIERRFLTTNTVYRYTCGNTNCDFTCGVPHLMLIVRRICRLTTRPLHVYVLGGIMGKVMDLQKRFLPDLQKRLLLASQQNVKDNEPEILMAKEFM
ncbi:hypothetical protein EJ05DRAFT_483641 [Pseudovirgaria hyperparasitica]|uniref:Uncharacterized protein n=1 Tax=Pseudovirgaria hyperparasitica TaxID=470096 RepID=A0A6A6WEK6_9PEZI|nr:uncharacterized protein EJ05DRAFT_483641 [Pseudovirgaria hyperparasitica]KAF2761258.1 hypothetical protein EJ05DRAFT_483641 [Pseudovirgaria hyperparasitica]